MNIKDAKQFLPLVQALADGKTIQSRNYLEDGWKDWPSDNISFSEPPIFYRVKPEPTVVWVIFNPGYSPDFVYPTEAAAKASCRPGGQVVKFIQADP